MWTGKIKLYTPGSGVSEAGSVSVYADNVENGLLGLAADPNFATNRWLYLFHSRRTAGTVYSAGENNVAPHEHVLMRMTFSDGKLGNPKEILSIKRLTKRHAAGGIKFNSATGDLYIPTGDDVFPGRQETYWGGRSESEAWLNDLGTAANTNDLRGKVLRIKPIPFADNATPAPGIGSTYQIPAGNLFPPGTDKTRPEIYTMGHRNPYKIFLDPVSGIGLVGEVGPDAPGADPARGPTGSDEFNLITGPGNYGWPFAIADNQPYVAHDGEAYPKGTTFDPARLKNLSKYNTGLEDLPPAIGALAYYNARNSQTGPNTVFGSGNESAMAGPYYRYDASKPEVRMPAYFHGKWIVGDYERGKVWSLELDQNKALKQVELLWNISRIIDLGIGPDGDLYVLQYNSAGSDRNTGTLLRMQYKGPHYASSLCPQYVFPTAPTALGSARGNEPGGGVRYLVLDPVTGARIEVPAGYVSGALYDLRGRRVWDGAVHDGALALPGGLGLHLALLKLH
jgi:glucose/arabinose dehydrogenase